VGVLPLYGGTNVPRMIKLGLALALTVMWFDFSGLSQPPKELLNTSEEVSLVLYGLAVGREAILGALLGYALGLFMVPARVAGEFLTQELGLSFGAFLNPTGEANVSALTQILDLLSILIFLGLDGHHVFFVVLHGTFTRYPIGTALLQVPVQPLVGGAALTEEWGLVLAAPMVLCLFVVTFLLTIMTRAAPQVNLFSVGFPLRMFAGLVVVLALLPDLLRSLVRVLGQYGELLGRLV
jgi:flagellar biosynthetic protein FliR